MERSIQIRKRQLENIEKYFSKENREETIERMLDENPCPGPIVSDWRTQSPGPYELVDILKITQDSSPDLFETISTSVRTKVHTTLDELSKMTKEEFIFIKEYPIKMKKTENTLAFCEAYMMPELIEVTERAVDNLIGIYERDETIRKNGLELIVHRAIGAIFSLSEKYPLDKKVTIGQRIRKQPNLLAYGINLGIHLGDMTALDDYIKEIETKISPMHYLAVGRNISREIITQGKGSAMIEMVKKIKNPILRKEVANYLNIA
ncbi:MAG: hypothetical protein AABW79_01265 [Nanoarchaeota archaeon]